MSSVYTWKHWKIGIPKSFPDPFFQALYAPALPEIISTIIFIHVEHMLVCLKLSIHQKWWYLSPIRKCRSHSGIWWSSWKKCLTTKTIFMKHFPCPIMNNKAHAWWWWWWHTLLYRMDNIIRLTHLLSQRSCLYRCHHADFDFEPSK